MRPATPHVSATSPRIVAARWQSLEDRVTEASARTDDECHLVCIGLRRMNIRLAVSGRVVQDGVTTPGLVQVTAPAIHADCTFRSAYDALHLHIPNSLLAECAGAVPGRGAGPLLGNPIPSHDPITERLGMALLAAEELGPGFAPIYADSLGIAIASRLLAAQAGTACSPRSSTAGLAKWRLKRAIDFVEAHLAEPISLADVAAAAGLTRMHFAAQFRAATGLRPHEYLQRRRVERAQQMLLAPSAAVVDVALEVGFQTQAHFTSVFKRFVGQPPHSWRQLQRRAA
jgi:AraC-like DNA-binding protein